MKKTILVCMFLLILGITQSYAQEDTTKIRPKLPTKLSFPNSSKMNESNQYLPKTTSDYKKLEQDPLILPKQHLLLDFGKPQVKSTVFNTSYAKFIIPAALISYGIATHTNKSLKKLDTSTNYEVGEHVSKKMVYDDYLQYAPSAAVYGLDLVGIKAKHNFRDRTLIMATSYLVMGATVQATKTLTKVERPDGSAQNSFPSGHTATAFLGAHVLFKEYKDVSPLIGIAGYGMAATTGTMRVLNKKHWVSDVVTGAGVGILSAEIGYMLLPVWHNILSIQEKDKSLVVMPMITTESAGVGLSYTF